MQAAGQGLTLTYIIDLEKSEKMLLRKNGFAWSWFVIYAERNQNIQVKDALIYRIFMGLDEEKLVDMRGVQVVRIGMMK